MHTLPIAALSFLGACAIALSACPESTPTEPTPTPSGPIEWTLVGPAIDGGAVFSVWGPTASDIWAVGGEPGRPLVLRFDGSAWSHDEPAAGEQLWWVHGADDTVMVVGDAGAAWMKRGGAWTEVSGGPAGTTLYGTWLASGTDGWAVGGPFDSAPDGVTQEGDVVLRFDGTQFVRQDIPLLAERTGQKRLFKVWGSSADDVWVVGSNGFVMRYDGASWTAMDTGSSAMLFTVTGRGPNDVWAVGGGAKAVLLHYDGTAWTEQELPEFAPQILQGVWTAPGQPVLVSGYYGFTGRLSDGVWEEPDLNTPDSLHTIFQDPSGRLWTGGGDIAFPKPSYTGILATSSASVPAVPGGGGPDAGPTDATSDASTPDVTEDTGPVACDDVATECPAELPHIGAACSGTLSCPYAVPDDVLNTVHTAECIDGGFGITTTCDPALGGGCTVPPLSEACSDPFSGTVSGAAVKVGPVTSEPFREFMPDEMIDLIWGGQGSPMFEFRVQLDGADDLTCGNVRAQIAIDGVPEVDATQPVVFRCGDTLLIFVIVPASPIDCEDKVFDLDVQIDVEGVGSTSTTVRVQGGQRCFG